MSILAIWITITAMGWGWFLNVYPPSGSTERAKYGIAFLMCVIIFAGYLYVDQRHETNIQLRISGFVDEGNKLKEDCMTEVERLDLKPLHEEWVKKVTEYLSSIDPSYAPRFKMIPIGKGGGIGPKVNEDIWNDINVKNQVLIEILKERKQLK
jgi:hypothetical protein